ncbi:2'-5' RNA ligase family protein [Pelagibacterium sp.]|uniref:2'-5' RNA ligase family protein n=1 Tax=Pelagibacterium sp. TaxID=1967288 RepID=UPI003BAA1965
MDAPLLFPQLPLAARPPFYFALRPDAVMAARIRALARNFQRREQIGGQLYPADRLHVSLCPIGLDGLRRGDMTAAMRAATEIAVESFPLRFDTAASVRGRGGHCLILRSSAQSHRFLQLVDGLRHNLARAGLSVPGGAGDPHLTMIRQTAETPEGRLATPIEWLAGEFVLARLGGSAGDDLGRWPLNCR